MRSFNVRFALFNVFFSAGSNLWPLHHAWRVHPILCAAACCIAGLAAALLTGELWEAIKDRVNPPTKCRYYGFGAVPELSALVDTGGNQCALKIASHSPCEMSLAGQRPVFCLCRFNEPQYTPLVQLVSKWERMELPAHLRAPVSK